MGSAMITISEQELHSDKWAKARAMCERYGYDIHEIAAGIARFRMANAEARAKALTAQMRNVAEPEARPANLVHFNSVKQYWDASKQRWSKPDLVYIGRAMNHLNLNLPASPFGNPFRIDKDSDDARADAIELYADWIMSERQRELLAQVDSLRGKTMVCWCKSPVAGKPSRACHGDILLRLMSEQSSYAIEKVDSQMPDAQYPPDYQPELKLGAF